MVPELDPGLFSICICSYPLTKNKWDCRLFCYVRQFMNMTTKHDMVNLHMYVVHVNQEYLRREECSGLGYIDSHHRICLFGSVVDFLTGPWLDSWLSYLFSYALECEPFLIVDFKIFGQVRLYRNIMICI